MEKTSTLSVLGMASAKEFLSAVGAAENEFKIVDTNNVPNYKGTERKVFLTFLVPVEGSPMKRTQFAAVPKGEYESIPTIENGFVKLVQSTDSQGNKGNEFMLFTKQGL